jgi:hypothetical protein
MRDLLAEKSEGGVAVGNYRQGDIRSALDQCFFHQIDSGRVILDQ